MERFGWHWGGGGEECLPADIFAKRLVALVRISHVSNAHFLVPNFEADFDGFAIFYCGLPFLPRRRLFTCGLSVTFPHI